MDLLLRNGRVICPESGKDGVFDLLLAGDRIAAMEPPGVLTEGPAPIRELSGMWVVPGLMDVHVHLREPGDEHKETILTGSLAAAAGGFTDICCMPNTRPPNDSPETTRFILDRARQAPVRVHPVAAITRGLAGKELTDFSSLKKAGAVALSDDGRPVADSALMRKAMDRARDLGLVICSHCEELSLAAGGAVNEGGVADRLGVGGISWASETIGALRDICLAELTGCRLHICHVSARQTVQAVAEAKARGVNVTCETAPHYFSLTEEALATQGAMAKMNPPLRTARDVEAVRRGLADGTIDAIATDHAPHAEQDKNQGLARAAFGISGLETAVPLCLALVSEGVLEPIALIRRLCVNPARALGLPPRSLVPGAPADLTVINPSRRFRVSPDEFFSKGVNTPFSGMELAGKVEATFLAGKLVHAAKPGVFSEL